MNFSRRSSEPELMDSERGMEHLRSALYELKKINRLLGGNYVTKRGISELKIKNKLLSPRILDAGSGSSDILADEGKGSAGLTALDINPCICRIAKEKNIRDVVCGSVLDLPFAEKSFDIVHASLFLHHFSDKQLPGLVTGLCKAAKYGVVINDLQRSFISYCGFSVIAALFSRSRLVRHDGAVSIRRGFVRDDLRKILEQSGCRYKIKFMWAFRWLIIIYTNERI